MNAKNCVRADYLACSSNPCKNDGTCYEGNSANPYQCVCGTEHYGKNCESRKYQHCNEHERLHIFHIMLIANMAKRSYSTKILTGTK